MNLSAPTLAVALLASGLWGAVIQQHLNTGREIQIAEATWNAAIECEYKHGQITWRGCR